MGSARLGNHGSLKDAKRVLTLAGLGVPSAIEGTGGHIVQDEGTPLTARGNLNFVGAGVVATDDEANNATVVTVPGATYKVYTAILAQSGTNAPTATVLENTIGGTFTWGRDAAGQYYVNRSGGFNGDYYLIEVHKRAGFAWAYMNVGTVLLVTYNTSNTLADGELNQSSWIEIREYT